MIERLLCFPWAGAGVSVYRHWTAKLPPDMELCPVALPGRESRFDEHALQEWPALLDSLRTELRDWIDQPFSVYGHSLGALIAFELFRRIPEVPLRRFVAAACASPQIWHERKRIAHLSDSELIGEVVGLEGTPAEVIAANELLQLLLPPLRADFRLCDEYLYTPGPMLRCPVLAFYGVEDESVDAARVSGWYEVATGSFRAESTRGFHLFLRTHADEVLRRVIAHIAA